MKKVDAHINELLAKIEAKTFHCLTRFVQDDMPESHMNTDALLSIILGLATRTICILCEGNEYDKEEVIARFSAVLSEMVKEARITRAHVHIPDKQQLH